MAVELTRVSRLYVEIDVAATLPGGGSATITGVDVALLPVGSGPDASTAWTAATYATGTATVLLAGPDAGGSGAIVVPSDADLWAKVTDAPEIDAAKVTRVSVKGGTVAVMPVATVTDAYVTGLVTGATGTRDALDARYVNEGAGVGGILSGFLPNPGLNDASMDAFIAGKVPGPSSTRTALDAAYGPRIAVADSTVTTEAVPRWVTIPWQPWTKPYQAEPDTLFMPGRWTTEEDFLNAGGRLAYAYDTYYAAGTTKATITTGKYGTPLVSGNAQGAYAVLPLDGIIAFDRFTVETSLISVGADFTAQTFGAAYTLLSFDGTGAQNEGLHLRRTAAGTLAAVLTNGSTTVTASLTIVVGDIPADTETGVSITYDGNTLTLILGNNTKSATATGTVTYGTVSSADHQLGGLLINPGTGGTSLGTAATPASVWRVAVPHVRRNPRTVNGQTAVTAAGVLIDATIPGLSWKPNLTGVMSQYYGWKDNLADGSAGMGTSIRDAAIAAAGAAGVPFARIDHVFDKVTVTGSAASPTVSDWSALDGPMDKWVTANPNIGFHITLGYTPSVLGATRATPPTDNAGFAALCSQAVTHWLAKGYKLTALSLWNEPGNSVFWTGTSAQMQALWAAVAGRLNTDFGSNSLVPKLGTTDGATTADMQAAMITQANASALPLGSYHFHDYSGQTRNVRNNIATAKGQLTGQAAGAGIYVTEWNDNQNVLAQIYTAPNSLATRNPDRWRQLRHAAFVHAQVQEMADAGAVGAAFTRLTILDDAYTAIERTLGLFSADNPPRPLPAFAAMSMLWKLSGAVVPVTSTSPALRCTATWDATGKKLTAVIGSYAPARIGQPAANVPLQWMNLPATFTWRMWRFTDADAPDGRPRLVSVGNQTNLPQGVELPACGLFCIQITTTSALATFTPETVTGRVLDFDASTITGLSDGAAVASWPDSGTGGAALVQATGSAQPTYKTNIVNGRPVVRFLSTSSQTMAASYGSDPIGTGAYSLAAVIYDNNSDGIFTQFRNSGDGGTAIKGYLRGANIRTLQRNNANTLVSPSSPITNNGVWEVVTLVWDGATLVLRVNGKQASSIVATGVITTNRFYLGSDNGTGSFVSGDVAKVMAFNTALDATTLHHVEQALGLRYGIAIA